MIADLASQFAPLVGAHALFVLPGILAPFQIIAAWRFALRVPALAPSILRASAGRARTEWPILLRKGTLRGEREGDCKQEGISHRGRVWQTVPTACR